MFHSLKMLFIYSCFFIRGDINPRPNRMLLLISQASIDVNGNVFLGVASFSILKAGRINNIYVIHYSQYFKYYLTFLLFIINTILYFIIRCFIQIGFIFYCGMKIINIDGNWFRYLYDSDYSNSNLLIVLCNLISILVMLIVVL
jgi:hypothetical protein